MRELDAKVAECLGWSRKMHSVYGCEVWVVVEKDGEVMDYYRDDETRFSEDGNAMLLLIGEARKKGIYLEFVHLLDGFQGEARLSGPYGQRMIACTNKSVDSAPLAVALAFLKAHKVDVTPYLEGVAVG